MEKKRILALIDGYNYYHKINTFFETFQKPVKWINYRLLLNSILNSESDDIENASIFYFSAISTSAGEKSIIKHLTFIEALKTVNIDITLGKFKIKDIPRCREKERCSACRNITDDNDRYLRRHEEKETDVNIAIKLIEATLLDQYDKCFLFSGDGDFVPAVKRALFLKPEKKIIIVPPPPCTTEKDISQSRYACTELIEASKNKAFLINFDKIEKSQFPNEINSAWEIDYTFKEENSKNKKNIKKSYNSIINPWQLQPEADKKLLKQKLKLLNGNTSIR